jgi:histidinol-phosphatase (PHP family)
VNITIDYHIHTSLCKHASGEMREYVEQAIVSGLTEIAFTDHNPLPDGFDQAHRMQPHELELYVNEVRRLQAAYPQIQIRLGIEADYYDGFENYLEDTLRRFDFDLVILSVHFIKGWPQNNWAFSYHFPDRSLTEVYNDYLQALRRGVNTGLFNVIGHLDLVKSPEQPLLKHNRDEVVQLLREARNRNMALELNTSGLRRAIGETYPSLDILPLLQQEDLAITFGSDAHQPQQVGNYFAELSAHTAAFSEIKYARFVRRKMETFSRSALRQ